MTDIGTIATDGTSPIRFMSTNGGDHSAVAWAMISADQICDLIRIDPASGSAAASAARVALGRLRAELVAVLAPQHAELQRDEDAALKRDARRLLAPHDPTQRLERALAAVFTATAETPFAAHFAGSRVREVVRGIIGSHLVTMAAARRSWRADQLVAAQPSHEAARQFQALRHARLAKRVEDVAMVTFV
jgi:hypothetical protein